MACNTSGFDLVFWWAKNFRKKEWYWHAMQWFSIRCSLEKPVPLSLTFVEIVLIQVNIPKMKIKCFSYLSYFRRPSLLELKTVVHSLYFRQVNYGFLIDVMHWLQ